MLCAMAGNARSRTITFGWGPLPRGINRSPQLPGVSSRPLSLTAGHRLDASAASLCYKMARAVSLPRSVQPRVTTSWRIFKALKARRGDRGTLRKASPHDDATRTCRPFSGNINRSCARWRRGLTSQDASAGTKGGPAHGTSEKHLPGICMLALVRSATWEFTVT